MGNSEGNNCEDCIDGFYNDTTTGAPYGTCVPCACNEFGSSNSVCMKQGGQCPCRPGVEPTSRTCDVCQDQFFGLSATGCDGMARHMLANFYARNSVLVNTVPSMQWLDMCGGVSHVAWFGSSA